MSLAKAEYRAHPTDDEIGEGNYRDVWLD